MQRRIEVPTANKGDTIKWNDRNDWGTGVVQRVQISPFTHNPVYTASREDGKWFTVPSEIVREVRRAEVPAA